VRGRPIQLRDFSGGLNLKAGAYGLAENEAASVQNFRPTMRGSLKSRAGDTNVLDTTDLGVQATMSLTAVEGLSAGAADDLLLGMADGSLYRYTSGSGATSLGTLTASAAWDWIDAPVSGGQGPVYGVNGTLARQITTAPALAAWTAATGTLPATARYLAYVGNRVWAAGMSAYGALADAGSALVFSNLGDPRDWPAANVVQFDPNDGESITGIGECGAGLLVFKPSKAWLVYDLDTGANRPLGAGVGCISHRSIAVTPYGTVWAGVKQVWVSDGSSVRPLADKLLSATPSSAPGIETYLLPGAAITGAYFDDRYQMSGQSADALTTFPLYEYDFVAKSWWQHTTYGGLLAIAQTASTAPQFYAAGTGRLDRMFDTPAAWLDSGGAALGRGWSGPYHTLGAGRDRLRGIEVEGSGMFGVAALPDFRDPLTGLGPREIRAEAVLAAGSTRRDVDFKVFNGVQVFVFAQGVSYAGPPLVVTPIPGYVPTDVQIDAYTLYVTRRPG
jgi:hypothetical protein